jgi:hypothetical protein
MDLASREAARHFGSRCLGPRNSQFTIFNDRQFGTARVQGVRPRAMEASGYHQK